MASEAEVEAAASVLWCSERFAGDSESAKFLARAALDAAERVSSETHTIAWGNDGGLIYDPLKKEQADG